MIALAAFGLPQLFTREVSDPEPIVVGIVEIAEQASAPKPKPLPPAPPPTAKKIEEPKPKPPEPEPPPVAKEEPKPPPPEPEPKPPEPEPEVKPEPKPEPEPEVKPEPKPVVAPKPPPKPKPPADLTSLLKNLSPKEPAPPAKEVEEKAEKPKPQLSDLLQSVANDAAETEAPDPQPGPQSTPTLAGPLAMTIVGAIRRKVEENWSVPAGIEGAANLLVGLTLNLGPDGTVQSVTITDYARYRIDTAFRAMADSAKRAVLKASPFDILRDHVDKYDQWRVITMTFKPPV
ncbi:MAG: energy transducer TonB [Alphaproteobacteria bacterium]|nr:energy transducer TonB [Alphaproteobacteria bacterium]